jgi:hypothetical protein
MAKDIWSNQNLSTLNIKMYDGLYNVDSRNVWSMRSYSYGSSIYAVL